MDDTANPDHLAQSAHSMRELLEKFGDDLSGRPRPRDKKADVGLENKVRDARDAYREIEHCFSGRGDSGRSCGIDEPLQCLLKDLNDFFAWFDRKRPTGWEQTVRAAQMTARHLSPLPDDWVEKNYDSWKSFRDYFNKVSHHREEADRKPFRIKIAELETFFLSVPAIKARMEAFDG